MGKISFKLAHKCDSVITVSPHSFAILERMLKMSVVFLPVVLNFAFVVNGGFVAGNRVDFVVVVFVRVVDIGG